MQFLLLPVAAFGLYVIFCIFADWGPWRRLFFGSLKFLGALVLIGVLFFIGTIVDQLSWGWKVIYGLFLVGIVGTWLARRRRLV